MITSNIEFDVSEHDRESLEHILKDVPQSIHPSIRWMFLGLKHLSMTMPAPHSANHAKHDVWLDEVDAFGLNMHKILAGDLSSRAAVYCGLWRVYTIAGNIFLCLFLRKTCLGSPVLKYLMNLLISATEKDKAGIPAPILLWFLFVGGAAAEGSSRRQWFLTRLPGVLLLLSIESWHDARDQLVVFPYTDGCALSFKKIWSELDFT